jgi:outer membrane protein assembly factor BamB
MLPRTAKSIALLTVLPALAAHANVLTYHANNTRQGAYVAPTLTQAAAANVKLDTGFNATVSGNVYAQPLFWKPKGSKNGEVIVATESNQVSALDGVTGATLWSVQLPASVPQSDLGCGDINPEGVTGTPVIDPKTGTLYLDALTLVKNKPTQTLYALSLANKGATLAGWPINVDAAVTKLGGSFSGMYQGERSAALFFDGTLYLTYGGRYGDCLPYRGTVVQVDPTKPALTATWQTGSGGGIWAQGGIAGDGKSLFITTGNTIGVGSTYSEGESIFRLLPGLAQSTDPKDFYAPANWQTLDTEDRDLGGTEAIPLNVDSGSGKPAPRVIAFGKDGNAYLVNRNNLGGIAGAASITPLSNTVILTAPAVYETPSTTMVAFTNYSAEAPCSGNVVMMINVAPSGSNPVSVAWCGAFSGGGSPMITTTDGSSNPIVWVLGAEGDNLLHGFNATTGAALFTGGGFTLSGLHHFQTLISANDRLYVGADGKVYAFTY